MTIQRSVVALLVAFAVSAAADPYAYTLTMTPEEGPVDPAIQGRFSPQWTACREHAVSAADTLACTRAEFARQDAALNRTWRSTLARLPSGAHAPLVVAERRWAASRDPFCGRFSGDLKGSLVSLADLDCRVEQTIRRTIWLEALR